MIEELLQQEEGKTLEFKENTKSLDRIMHTIIAFPNKERSYCLVKIEKKVFLMLPNDLNAFTFDFAHNKMSCM